MCAPDPKQVLAGALPLRTQSPSAYGGPDKSLIAICIHTPSIWKTLAAAKAGSSNEFSELMYRVPAFLCSHNPGRSAVEGHFLFIFCVFEKTQRVLKPKARERIL